MIIRSNHCGRRGCRCTHSEGCDHGLICNNDSDGVYADSWRHCPVCWPEAVQQPYETREDWLDRRRALSEPDARAGRRREQVAS